MSWPRTWTPPPRRGARRWWPSGVPRSSSWCGRRASGTPIRVAARSSPSPGKSGRCRCSTSTSGTTRWAAGSSRSAPTSPIRLRHGSTGTSGPSGRRWPPGSASPRCPTGSPPARIRPGLRAICDRFGPGTVQVWFERWMARIPLPLTGADRDAGYWWELSMRQVETSRTLVFDDDCHARAFFEALLCDNMDLGRPDNVELLFRRGQRLGRPTIPPARGGFKTKIDRYCDLVTLNVFYKNSRLKQYLKDGVALRV